MNCPDYNSPQALKKILDEKGFAMQKKFGQNFLTSPDAREKIIALLELVPGEAVWEVGPGLGAMTSGLLAGGRLFREKHYLSATCSEAFSQMS